MRQRRNDGASKLNNHDSFLKLIGLDQEKDLGEELVAEKSRATKKESSWTAMIPGAGEVPTIEAEAQQEAGTPTEWAPVDEEAPKSDWAEAPLNEAAQEMNRAEQEQANAEISWGEPSQGPQTASTTEPDLGTEKTELYALEEASSSGTAVYTPAERSRISHGEKLSTQTSSRAMTLTQGPGGTRPTVAYDYEKPPTQETTEGTAHFDYSQKQTDGRIVVLEGKANAQAFHLGNLPLRFGRDPSNEVILDDSNVSRFHAEIREHNGGLLLADLGSTNGIKVNGELLAQKELNSHDVIQIGDCVFEYLPSGVLSKGAPKFSAIAGDSKVTRRRGMNRLQKIAAAIVVILGGLYFGYQFFVHTVGDSIVQKTKQMAAERAEVELTTVRSQLENQFQKPINEIDSAEVKSAIIKQIDGSGFKNILPPELLAQIQNLPPEILQYFVSRPETLKELIALDNPSLKSVNFVLRNRVNAHLNAKEYKEAYHALSMIVKLNPNDEELRRIYDKLRARLESELNEKDSTGYTPAEKRFYEHMERHENFVMKLEEEGKFSEAAAFARGLTRNIGELIRLDPSFERVANEEKIRWQEKTDRLQKRADEKEAKKQADNSQVEEGRIMLGQIKEALNFGNAAEARRLIEDFYTNYPKHPDRDEVYTLQEQLDSGVEKSFESTLSRINTMLEAESYENAWKEYYRFVETMPKHPKLKDLYASIEAKSEARAVQYYNQARVFEFEADDLVAAEQYYKKTLDTADPKSELAKKAGRRYAEVKKRGIQ